MMYMIYAYNYIYGWEIYGSETKLEKLYNALDGMDPYEYGQYIVVKRKRDRDEPFMNGIVAKPKEMKLTKKKKK